MELEALESNEPQAAQFSRQELYDLVWMKPVSKIAPRFGLSGAGLSKICARHKIPTPGRGYWQRVCHGHRVRREPLPKLNDDPVIAIKKAERRPSTVTPVEEGPVGDQKRFEAQEQNRIQVSDTLRRMHPFVRQTRDVWKRRRARDYSYGENLPPTLDIRVSDESKRRALLIMNALLKALGERDYPVHISDRRKHPTVVTVCGEKVQIRLEERQKKVEREPTDWERQFSWSNRPHYDLEYTGRLTLRITTWGADGERRTWTDGRIQRVEKCLNDFVVAVVATAERVKARRKRREELAQAAARERQARLEQQRLQELEEERAAELKRQVEAWELSTRIRCYLEAWKENRNSGPGPSGPDLAESEWMAWARRYSRKVDPLSGETELSEC